MTLLFFFFNKTKQNISQLLFLCWPNLHWIYLCSNTIPVIVIKYSLSQIFYLYDKKSFFPKRFILWVKTFKHIWTFSSSKYCTLKSSLKKHEMLSNTDKKQGVARWQRGQLPHWLTASLFARYRKTGRFWSEPRCRFYWFPVVVPFSGEAGPFLSLLELRCFWH